MGVVVSEVAVWVFGVLGTVRIEYLLLLIIEFTVKFIMSLGSFAQEAWGFLESVGVNTVFTRLSKLLVELLLASLLQSSCTGFLIIFR